MGSKINEGDRLTAFERVGVSFYRMEHRRSKFLSGKTPVPIGKQRFVT